MLEKMKEMIGDQLNVDVEQVTEATSFKDDLGADSLDVFQIVMGIEEEFDIQIEAEEAEHIVSVEDAVETAVNRKELEQVINDAEKNALRQSDDPLQTNKSAPIHFLAI